MTVRQMLRFCFRGDAEAREDGFLERLYREGFSEFSVDVPLAQFAFFLFGQAATRDEDFAGKMMGARSSHNFQSADSGEIEVEK